MCNKVDFSTWQQTKFLLGTCRAYELSWNEYAGMTETVYAGVGVCWVGSDPLTCNQIRQLGQSVSQLEVSRLQTLTSAEYVNCAYQLGRVVNFTAEQWKALADVAKKVDFIHC